MKIYLCHSTGFDYQNIFYKPIVNSSLNAEHVFIFPHETSNSCMDSKETIHHCDFVLAEASYPSTGLGIELGWADMYKKPIMVFYKEGSFPSSALKMITEDMIQYPEDGLIEKISEKLSSFSLKSSLDLHKVNP